MGEWVGGGVLPTLLSIASFCLVCTNTLGMQLTTSFAFFALELGIIIRVVIACFNITCTGNYTLKGKKQEFLTLEDYTGSNEQEQELLQRPLVEPLILEQHAPCTRAVRSGNNVHNNNVHFNAEVPEMEDFDSDRERQLNRGIAFCAIASFCALMLMMFTRQILLCIPARQWCVASSMVAVMHFILHTSLLHQVESMKGSSEVVSAVEGVHWRGQVAMLIGIIIMVADVSPNEMAELGEMTAAGKNKTGLSAIQRPWVSSIPCVVICGVLSSAFMSFDTLAIRCGVAEYDHMLVFSRIFIIVGVISLFVANATEDIAAEFKWTTTSAHRWLMLTIAASAFTAALRFHRPFNALRLATLQSAMACVPLFCMLTAAVLFGKAPSWMHLIGAAMIVCGARGIENVEVKNVGHRPHGQHSRSQITRWMLDKDSMTKPQDCPEWTS